MARLNPMKVFCVKIPVRCAGNIITIIFYHDGAVNTFNSSGSYIKPNLVITS